jgi:hypothetical protein
VGITFDCPCSAVIMLTGHPHNVKCPRRIFVFFDKPLDGGAPIPGERLWQRSGGDSFETMTLAPSIDASGEGHWHGWVRDGEVS